jgi:GNAT superfamily N-acetyltransferase
MTASLTSRRLRPTDIPACLQLSAEAGWNQTAEDWRTLIELSPEGCLGIEAEGELAASTTLLCYGKKLAWIGMVLTRVRYRGRGFARQLMTEAVALADQIGIETLKLDATDQGQPLYEKLGFRCEQPVERWSRPASVGMENVQTSRKTENSPHTDWRSGDHRAFGADRSQLLEKLAQRQPPLSIGCSYLLTRPGRVTRYLGPCVAETSAIAQSLMERALHSMGPNDCAWDLLLENQDAVALARNLGFVPKRHLMRMVRGKDLRGDDASVYAIAGFELG